MFGTLVKRAAVQTIEAWWNSTVSAIFAPRCLSLRLHWHQAVLAVRIRRKNASRVIQRAYAEMKMRRREAWDEMIYIHVNCPSTAIDDAVYRAALEDALACVEIRLTWVPVDKLAFGPNGTVARIIRTIDSDTHTTLLVIGSHGLLSSATGFIVAEDLRTKGQRVLPVPTVEKQIRAIRSDLRLFFDSCYSTVGRGDGNYDGHSDDPQYADANFRLAQWAELSVLEACTTGLGLEQ
jgi:hypothetical protein